MSDVGGVLVDKDAVYIDVGGKEIYKTGTGTSELKGEGEKLVNDLQEISQTMTERLEDGPGLQLFSSSKALNQVDEDDNNEEEDDDEEGLLSDEETIVDTGRSSLRKARVYGKSVSEDDEFDELESDEEQDGDQFSDDEDKAENNLKVEVWLKSILVVTTNTKKMIWNMWKTPHYHQMKIIIKNLLPS